MTLAHCNMSTCLTIALATLSSSYLAITIKNHTAKAVETRIKHFKHISIENYGTLIKDLGIFTRCAFLAYLIFYSIYGNFDPYQFIYIFEIRFSN